MKKIVSLFGLLLMVVASWAQVSYDVIPLPKSVQLSPKGESYTLSQGAVVTYDGQNPTLASDAQLLVNYLKATAGLNLKARPDVKKGAAIELKIKNEKSKSNSENTEAYQLTVDKRGVTILGASGEAVFRGIQTLVKSIGVEPGALEFLKKVLDEVADVFPSKYIHIGGDESPRDRWKQCPKCQAKMKELGLKKEAELQTYINKELEAYM